MSATTEISELQAVDFALGDYISKAFIGIAPTDGPALFRQFLSADVKAKIFRTDESEPLGVLKEYMKKVSPGNETETRDGKPVNIKKMMGKLPIIAYGRKPGLQVDPERAYYSTSVSQPPEALALSTDKTHEVGIHPLTLTYTMLFLAWDKLTLDKMQVAWVIYAATHSKFAVKYNILGTEYAVDGKVTDAKNAIFSDVSMPPEEGRLWAVSLDLMIKTDVVSGNGVTLVDPVRWILTIEEGMK